MNNDDGTPAPDRGGCAVSLLVTVCLLVPALFYLLTQ